MNRRSTDAWLVRASMAWDFVDNRGIIRRLVLAVAIGQTAWVTQWAMRFAETSARPGIDIAAILAAVTAPVTLFAGAVFKNYVDSRPAEAGK